MKNLFERAIESSVNFIKKHKTIIINIGALVGGAAIGIGVDRVLTPQKKPEEKTLVVVVPVIKEEKEAED